MLTKDAPTEFKADVDNREITGYAAMFNQLGNKGDVIEPGAFRQTLSERYVPPGGEGKNKVRALWNHMRHKPIGRPTMIEPDTRGLKFTIQATEGVKAADEALRLIDADAINQMSFGFDAVEYRHDTFQPSDANAEPTKARFLEKVKLYELSPVTFAANENTDVSRKGLFELLNSIEQKEGRVLSQENVNKIIRAIRRQERALEQLREMVVDKVDDLDSALEGSEDSDNSSESDGEKSSDYSSVKSTVNEIDNWITQKLRGQT
jgi:HK97 family phage prohead protease